jgi:threonine synthase
MVVAVARAMESEARAVLCASTGNTSASAAAYAAHCGLDAYVLVPSGNIAQGKLAQAVAHGAKVLNVAGNFDEALRIARAISEQHPVALVNSVNPYRIEGQKTAAFEIVDALGDAPDLVFIPVGNAGNITAYWRGFVEYFQSEQSSLKPRMFGWQAEGADPIVRGEAVADPQTVASAIRIGNPASWRFAEAARDESGGAIQSVNDEEILEAYRLLAREEGIFCEPASAACVAGLLKLTADSGQRTAMATQRVVCIITGHGLKDPDTALSVEAEMVELPAEQGAVERAMGLG